MLFNSYEFVFLFLPVTLVGFFLLGRTRYSELANVWLVGASLVFYACWDVRFVPLLTGCIVVNYLLAGGILHARATRRSGLQKLVFWTGIAFNLGVLCWFKYSDFLLFNLNRALGTEIPLPHVLLPLGISFYTFTQILCLVDCHAGVVRAHRPVDYALFVTFFPHLLAGPILYHKPMTAQFRNPALRRPNWENLSLGFGLFCIGLVKKVVVGDSFIVCVNHGFAHTADLSAVAA